MRKMFSLLILGLLATVPQIVAQVIYSGDGSGATEGGSHQVITTIVGTLECKKMTFENGGELANIHGGGESPGSGMSFPGAGMFSGWITISDSDDGGLGNIANEPSPSTIAFWLEAVGSQDVFFTDPVSTVSLFFTSTPMVTLEAFDASDVSLGSVSASGNFNQGMGDPNGEFNTWTPLSVDVGANTIAKVTVTGQTLNVTGIDDIEACEIVRVISCVGFEPPVANGPVKVKKNRVIPFKADLFELDGTPVTDLDIVAQPVVQVLFDSGVGPATDVTDDALSAGQGTNGNEFEFNNSKWAFNLQTKNYSAAGTYTVSMVSGDGDEYIIHPACEGTFVIE